jgi:hypothetical protein
MFDKILDRIESWDDYAKEKYQATKSGILAYGVWFPAMVCTTTLALVAILVLKVSNRWNRK